MFGEFGMVRAVFIDSLLSLEANKLLRYWEIPNSQWEFGTVDLEFGMVNLVFGILDLEFGMAFLEFGMVSPAFINSFLLF